MFSFINLIQDNLTRKEALVISHSRHRLRKRSAPKSIIHIRIQPRKTSHSDINDKSTYKSKQRCASQSFTQLSKTNTAFNHSISSSGILKKLDVWSDKNCLTIDHHRNIEKKKTKSVLIFTKMKYS